MTASQQRLAVKPSLAVHVQDGKVHLPGVHRGRDTHLRHGGDLMSGVSAAKSGKLPVGPSPKQPRAHLRQTGNLLPGREHECRNSVQADAVEIAKSLLSLGSHRATAHHMLPFRLPFSSPRLPASVDY